MPQTKYLKQNGEVIYPVTLAENIVNLVDIVYPIGSIYLSVNATNPASLFGGTWVQLQNRFLLGAGSSYTNGATGGSATMAHTHSVTAAGTNAGTAITKDQMPSHDHNIGFFRNALENGDYGLATGNYGFGGRVAVTGTGYSGNTGGGKTHTHTFTGSAVTSGAASNADNMPPYLVVYMWKRTA